MEKLENIPICDKIRDNSGLGLRWSNKVQQRSGVLRLPNETFNPADMNQARRILRDFSHTSLNHYKRLNSLVFKKSVNQASIITPVLGDRMQRGTLRSRRCFLRNCQRGYFIKNCCYKSNWCKL